MDRPELEFVDPVPVSATAPSAAHLHEEGRCNNTNIKNSFKSPANSDSSLFSLSCDLRLHLLRHSVVAKQKRRIMLTMHPQAASNPEVVENSLKRNSRHATARALKKKKLP